MACCMNSIHSTLPLHGKNSFCLDEMIMSCTSRIPVPKPDVYISTSATSSTHDHGPSISIVSAVKSYNDLLIFTFFHSSISVGMASIACLLFSSLPFIVLSQSFPLTL